MGIADEQELQERDNGKRGSKSRGSVNNKKRLDAFREGAASGSADWGGCDGGWIQAVIVAVSRMGGAVTFGLSRDGGAHFLTLLLDQDKQTLWFNGDADLDAELERVYATLDSMQ